MSCQEWPRDSFYQRVALYLNRARLLHLAEPSKSSAPPVHRSRARITSTSQAHVHSRRILEQDLLTCESLGWQLDSHHDLPASEGENGLLCILRCLGNEVAGDVHTLMAIPCWRWLC